MKFLIVVMLLLTGVLSVEAKSQFSESLRSEVCLNGTWKLQVDGIEQPADVRVPSSYAGQDQLWGHGHWDVWGYPTAWYDRAAVYRKTFLIPENLGNQRVLIHFGGVRHVVTVEVNGKEAGRWSDSYIPFAFDITDLVHAGENSMQVHIAKDKTCGLFEDYNQNRRGIYQDVHLQFVPEVRVTPDIYIQTSVINQEMTCEVPVRNDSEVPQTFGLRFKVIDANGTVVKNWSAKESMTVAPGAVETMTVSEPWENPHLWSLDDPNLYHLETEVVNADKHVLDRYSLRFGFREITWEGPHLFLNGNEIFLRGHGGHELGDLQHSKEYAELWIKQLKDQGMELMRLHDYPRDDALYDAADEMGFLFLSETAHHFRLPPMELQMAHTERMVKRLRNRPSVLMWSVANELHWRNFEEPVHLIELCRKLDPTRPAFNSDFSAYSLHGDVIAHHYKAEEIWNDWEKYGPDKVMVWDEIGNVWQHDRPLKTGPAGFEISSQDVATGIWRDGWEQMRSDIEVFANGKEMNGELYRVNAYIPWEFSYVFYRFQPLNNFQRFYPEYDDIEGEKGMKPLFINPCSTTHNLWDPTLPEFQPNAALYCFNEYLARVRFPDDSKERTFFSGQTLKQNGRLFYEDYRPADQVEFRVETPEGKVLNAVTRNVSLAAGEYVPEFASAWKLPVVDTMTPLRLVRQFSYQGEVGYRKVSEAKVFPTFQSVDLTLRKIAVVGTGLQRMFGGAGVPVADAEVIIAESMNSAWETLVAKGVRVLVLSAGDIAAGKQLSHHSMVPKAKQQGFTGPVENVALADGSTLAFGTPGKERSTITGRSFNVDQPVSGAWATFNLDASFDFSETGLIQLDYTIWLRPGEDGLAKSFARAGGAPFFRKTIRPMLSDSSGRWFVSGENDAGELTRDFPAAFRGSVAFDALRLSWEPVRLESGAVVTTGEKIAPDFRTVSAIGFVFEETNPGAPVQFTSISLRGGAKADASIQPGSVTHRLVAGLGQEDFAFWRGGSATRNMTVPPGRNVRRILFGNKDGSGSALQEIFIGRGVVLESALNTANLEEPVAGFLLNRMVDYLVDYQPAGTAANLVVVGEGPFETWAKTLGASVQSELSASTIAAVDAQNATALAESKSDLIAHLEQGGTVWFSDVTPDTIELVREISGKPLRLTDPYFGQRFYCIKAPVSWARVGSPHEWVDYYDGILAPYPFEPNFSPLLAGIANLDLDWKGTAMFRQGIEIEGMNPVSASADHQVLISNWHIGSEPTDHLYGENLNGVRDLRQSSWFVNRDPVVMELSSRGGRILISQLDLQAGGKKAARLMQTLLTNLGVSFAGAVPAPADAVYDSNPRSDQLARFAVYDQQIDPVQRQFYGVPNPMPDYLKDTQIGAVSTEKVELPLMGFFGDSLTLGLAKPLAEKLDDVVQMDQPVVLHRSRSAGGILKKNIGDKKYARVVFSIGEIDAGVETTDAEFTAHLEAILKVLSEHSQKVSWVPAPSAYGKGENAPRARELNQIATEFFDGKDVYMLPFVYADQTDLPSGYFSGFSTKFQPEEAKVLADRLGEGVISFGAQ
ncbi:glycoside hydrolase family 2 TIM barrel-domain containing protein [Coraliomargarita algicola]|uniref:Glycoside hydrolase family 2 TIM barrel-domain containing protein n=1 Tax=Coraliomargarita algicola TaxID=3092156 RepID=A0ABZ0RMF4_9BACT|nr:sugar-binding domain-containing protein [Coraliomargarita sp. J2-16]WPJ96283.1 glycoside hydrolase family 2 TIM barrel-domain containing protein [Coraliomargarita sp. J2-16]